MNLTDIVQTTQPPSTGVSHLDEYHYWDFMDIDAAGNVADKFATTVPNDLQFGTNFTKNADHIAFPSLNQSINSFNLGLGSAQYCAMIFETLRDTDTSTVTYCAIQSDDGKLNCRDGSVRTATSTVGGELISSNSGFTRRDTLFHEVLYINPALFSSNPAGTIGLGTSMAIPNDASVTGASWVLGFWAVRMSVFKVRRAILIADTELLRVQSAVSWHLAGNTTQWSGEYFG